MLGLLALAAAIAYLTRNAVSVVDCNEGRDTSAAMLLRQWDDWCDGVILTMPERRCATTG
jgi:hypothetical protein